MADFGKDAAGSSADSLGGYSGLGLGGDVDLGSMPDWAGALNAGAESEGGTDASALNSLLAGPFGQPSGPDSLGGPDAWTSARDAAQSQQQFVSDRLAQQAADQTGAAGAFSGVDEHDTFFLGGLFSDDTASAMDLGLTFEALPPVTPTAAPPADSSGGSVGPSGLTLGFASADAASGAGAPTADSAPAHGGASSSDPADAAAPAAAAPPSDVTSWDAAPAPGASIHAHHVSVVGQSTPTHGPGAGVWMYAPIRASVPGTGPAEHITNRAMALFGQVPHPPTALAGKRMSKADANQVAVIQAAQRHRSGVLSTSAQFYLQALRCKRAHIQLQAHRRALQAGMPTEGPPPPPMMALVMPMTDDEAVERIAGANKTSAAITSKRLAFATEHHALAQTAGGNIRRPRQLLRLSMPAAGAGAGAGSGAGAGADSESKSSEAVADSEAAAERTALWKARARIDSVFEAVIHLADVQVAADALRSSLQQQEQAAHARAFQQHQQQQAAAAAAAAQRAAAAAAAEGTAASATAVPAAAPAPAGAKPSPKPKGYAAAAAGAAGSGATGAAGGAAAGKSDDTPATKRPRGSTRGRRAGAGAGASTAASTSTSTPAAASAPAPADGKQQQQQQQQRGVGAPVPRPAADPRTVKAFTDVSAAVIERKQGLAMALGLPKGTPLSAERYADLEAVMSLPKGKRLLLRALPKLLPEDFDSALTGLAALMVHMVCSALESPEHEAADAMLARSWAGWVSAMAPAPEAMATGDVSNVLCRLERILSALTASHEADILAALLSHPLGLECVQALVMRGEAERGAVAGAAAGLAGQVEAAAAEAAAAEAAGQAVPAEAADAVAAARARVEAWNATVAQWSATTERMAAIVDSAQAV